jgi:P4 family phage/plasmid primase-like protien
MHEGLIDYKSRAFGVLLSGEVPEILWIAHGGGSNGKTSELETISQILGDYSHAADAGLLITNKVQGGPTPEIVALMGKRAVFINETEQKDWLNEARVKYICATDTMSGRNLHQSPINWEPTHKPWLRTNHKPRIRGTDLGLWRRIHYVPYSATIATKDAILNFRRDHLLPELPGILNWMLAGWLAYLKAGRKLNLPKCVQDAVAEYKKDSDITRQWIDAVCIHDPEAPNMRLKDLHALYEAWYHDEQGEKGAVHPKTLLKAFEDAGFETVMSKGFRWVKKIRLDIPDPGLDLGPELGFGPKGKDPSPGSGPTFQPSKQGSMCDLAPAAGPEPCQKPAFGVGQMPLGRPNDEFPGFSRSSLHEGKNRENSYLAYPNRFGLPQGEKSQSQGSSEPNMAGSDPGTTNEVRDFELQEFNRGVGGSFPDPAKPVPTEGIRGWSRNPPEGRVNSKPS